MAKDQTTSIIERDLEFYKGCVEGCTDRLYRCYPDEEASIKRERRLCQEVVDTMQKLADLYRPAASTRPGDAAAIYAEETGVDYATALVHCNMD
jgi:hypothetical protein